MVSIAVAVINYGKYSDKIVLSEFRHLSVFCFWFRRAELQFTNNTKALNALQNERKFAQQSG